MSNFANIKLPANRLIDPHLKVLVDKLALNNPKWAFSTNKDSQTRGIGFKYDDPAGKAPDGFTYTRTIIVREEGEMLGQISVDSAYRRNSYRPLYEIKSWRIETSRGNQNTTRTEKLDIAARKAKKSFVRMDNTEFLTKAIDAVESNLRNTLHTLRKNIYDRRLVKDIVYLQKWAYCVVRNLPMPDEINKQIKETFDSDQFEKAMGEYELATDFGTLFDNKKTVVVAEKDGHYVFRDEHDVIMTVEYANLPQAWQERIAVLQLMQDEELVRDVGYRYNDRNFMIVV
jgi:hypothetical protein